MRDARCKMQDAKQKPRQKQAANADANQLKEVGKHLRVGRDADRRRCCHVAVVFLW